MAEDDEVRELIGRMSAAQRQGFHITPAAVRIVLAALRFYLTGQARLVRPNADPHDDAPRRKAEPYRGPPATIGNLRAQGLEAVSITCDGPNCWNSSRVAFDALGLSDETEVPAIARWRGFRCSRCGSRRVRVSPDWTDHQAKGNGRVPQLE